MSLTCCSYDAPAVLGDEVAIITIEAGSPTAVTGLVLYAEGCAGAFAGYSDTYSDSYGDPTEGGLYPNARITTFEFTIDEIPAGTTLVIDAADRTISITQNGVQVGGLDALTFTGLFEWIEAAKGGCQRVCVETGAGVTNADTTVAISTIRREL